MGRGSKTHKVGVIKERSEAISSTTGTGGNATKKAVDSCVFSFSSGIIVSSSIIGTTAQNSKVVLVPHHSVSGNLEIFIDGKNFGLYSGRNLQRILSCIQNGFVYEGIVASVTTKNGQSIIKFQIQGA